MTRPRIICHMITSLDGRLLVDRWPVSEERILESYDAAANRLPADGWIVGRTTMEHFLPSAPPATPITGHAGAAPRADRPGDRQDRPVAICFDRRGSLRPETDDLEGDHLVLVLSDRVAPDHVDDLAARGVSVFFAGPDGADIAGALDRMGRAFGLQLLLLEGGGHLNGAFLAAGLVDETSTLVFPVLDGESGGPAIYERAGAGAPAGLTLISAETMPDGTVWLRHAVDPA